MSDIYIYIYIGKRSFCWKEDEDFFKEDLFSWTSPGLLDSHWTIAGLLDTPSKGSGLPDSHWPGLGRPGQVWTGRRHVWTGTFYAIGHDLDAKPSVSQRDDQILHHLVWMKFKTMLSNGNKEFGLKIKRCFLGE